MLLFCRIDYRTIFNKQAHYRHLHELLSTKPVSLNFFNALDNKRKLISTNYWEVFAARKKWMEEKKIADQQIQFVQLKKEKLYYGLYSR